MHGCKQLRKVRRAVLQAVALACACLMVGACGVQNTDPEHVDLADVVLAVGLNPHSKDVVRANTGLVALVHADGTAEFVDTKGMTPQNMAWNTSGLFFDDSENHFFISQDRGHGYVSRRENASAPGSPWCPWATARWWRCTRGVFAVRTQHHRADAVAHAEAAGTRDKAGGVARCRGAMPEWCIRRRQGR